MSAHSIFSKGSVIYATATAQGLIDRVTYVVLDERKTRGGSPLWGYPVEHLVAINIGDPIVPHFEPVGWIANLHLIAARVFDRKAKPEIIKVARQQQRDARKALARKGKRAV